LKLPPTRDPHCWRPCWRTRQGGPPQAQEPHPGAGGRGAGRRGRAPMDG